MAHFKRSIAVAIVINKGNGLLVRNALSMAQVRKIRGPELRDHISFFFATLLHRSSITLCLTNTILRGIIKLDLLSCGAANSQSDVQCIIHFYIQVKKIRS